MKYRSNSSRKELDQAMRKIAEIKRDVGKLLINLVAI